MTNNKEPEFTAKITKEEAIRIATEFLQPNTELVESVSALYEGENQLWVVFFDLNWEFLPSSLIVKVDASTGEAGSFHNF